MVGTLEEGVRQVPAGTREQDESTADTTFLAEDANLLATGNRYQFLPPQFSDSVIPYETWPGRLFVLSGELAVVADSQVVR